MATLESLPADQRAVLALVLQRGHTFDEIAEMLSIDRAAVRDRALRGLDTLGPETDVDAPRRGLITDYLLGQLPPRVAETVHAGLAESPAQRAWARVLAAELAPVSINALPEIPSGAPAKAAPATKARAAKREPRRRSPPEPAPAPTAEPRVAAAGAETEDRPADSGGTPPPSSRVGGAILIGIGVVAVIAVVVIVLATSGGSKSSSSTAATQASASTTAQTSTAASTTSAQTPARPVAQVNLASPSGDAKLKGVGIVVRQGTTLGLVIRAQNVPANTGRNAYAVWLYNSSSDEHILGFVNPGVSNTGVLQTAGPLPSNASRYSQLIVTLESTAKPSVHGPIVLQGPLKITG